MKKIFVLALVASLSIISCGQKTGSLDFLKNFNGKYPEAMALFEHAAFTQRLETLLGREQYRFLIETWAVEVPMDMLDGVFAASGCERHNCAATNFIIVYSFADDAMYAGVRVEGQVSVFSEKKNSSHKKIEDWAAPDNN
jgi:hypothetical protein